MVFPKKWSWGIVLWEGLGALTFVIDYIRWALDTGLSRTKPRLNGTGSFLSQITSKEFIKYNFQSVIGEVKNNTRSHCIPRSRFRTVTLL